MRLSLVAISIASGTVSAAAVGQDGDAGETQAVTQIATVGGGDRLPAVGNASEAEDHRATIIAAASVAGGEEPGGRDLRAARRRLGLKRIGNFREPVHVAQPPRTPHLLFVVERKGVIRVLRRGRKLGRPFLDIRRRVRHSGTEQGLLSVAFPPGYRRSRRFYVAYTGNGGDLRVEEFRRSRRSGAVALRRSRRHLLSVKQLSPTHHGGSLVFGPDGFLYVGSGDGGLRGDPHLNGQDRTTLRAKLLRIDPRPRRGRPYTTPRKNPFKGRRGRDEIYAMGLRNPWRFSFDRRSGMLAIGDVGQDEYEEVDLVRRGRGRGANFGWPAFEGRFRYKRRVPVPRRYVRPAITYRHFPRCAVTGGYVVRDRRVPRLFGRYVYGDFCTGELFSITPGRGVRSSRILPLRVALLASFGEDIRGRIYAVSLNGPVYRIVQR